MSRLPRSFCTFAAWIAGVSAIAAPPVVEISDARPLFVFQAPDRAGDETTGHAERLVNAWYQLPDSIQNSAAYGFDLTADGVDFVEIAFLFDILRSNGIAVTATVATADRALSPESIADLFASNPNLVAIHADRIPLPGTSTYGGLRAAEPSPELRWLTRSLDLCAGHGRFLTLEWGTADWLRLLSDRGLEPVYHALRYYAPYVVLVHPMEHPTVLTATGALMGLWLEGAADHWGVSMSPDWYYATDFVQPGHWGPREAGAHAPPATYRAMALAGAMAGATVYRFEDPADLWFGERGYQWAETIAPTLNGLIDLGAIPRRDLAARSVQLVYQCGTEEQPAPLAVIWNDVSAAFGRGGLERYLYGSTAPRAHPDLFPNRTGHYLVPLISPYAGPEIRQRVPTTITAGLDMTDEEWSQLQEWATAPAADGEASIIHVGRSVFVLHNRENAYERQTYRIPDMPAPVLGVKARRTEDGIELNWPFRENDFAYTVYRRTLPELTFAPIARNLDVRSYVDATALPGETVAYALTALTNEQRPIEGAINWGEYRVYSAAVSRIEEEVIVLPETEIAIASPVPVITKDYPAEQPLWPAIKGLSPEDTETALEVAQRLEQLQQAVEAEDAAVAAGLFAREYQGADGSNAAFAAHVFEAFFERYDQCRLFLQPHEWAVESGVETRVSVTFYAHLSGVERLEPEPALREIRAIANVKFGQRDGDWRIITAQAPFPALADAAP